MARRFPSRMSRSRSAARTPSSIFFFFNDTATTEIYTLSLHDALPIASQSSGNAPALHSFPGFWKGRSEEHTSELQSRRDLVCRLLLEKKKQQENQALFDRTKITDHIGKRRQLTI